MGYVAVDQGPATIDIIYISVSCALDPTYIYSSSIVLKSTHAAFLKPNNVKSPTIHLAELCPLF